MLMKGVLNVNVQRYILFNQNGDSFADDYAKSLLLCENIRGFAEFSV